MADIPFNPSGPTVLVGTTALQVSSTLATANIAYRIRAMLGTQQYLTYYTSQPRAAVTVTAPTAGNPSPSTIGLLPNSVEVFTLPANAWFQADASAAFEITPGAGS